MNGPVVVTSVGYVEIVWKRAILNLDAPKNLVPCTGSALLFWMDFEKKTPNQQLVTAKKPVASGEGEPGVHVVRVLLSWGALAGRFTTIASGYQVSVGGCLLLSSLL